MYFHNTRLFYDKEWSFHRRNCENAFKCTYSLLISAENATIVIRSANINKNLLSSWFTSGQPLINRSPVASNY